MQSVAVRNGGCWALCPLKFGSCGLKVVLEKGPHGGIELRAAAARTQPLCMGRPLYQMSHLSTPEAQFYQLRFEHLSLHLLSHIQEITW